MVELNHDVKDVSADVLVKGNHGVIVAVHVTKVGASGDKIELRNGTSTSDTLEFTVFGESIQNVQDINRRFESGIYADVTGTTARYLIVYK